MANLHGQPEIFYSIQGEGRFLGRPSIFVRTSLCNLHCAWCDTAYTWNWEGSSFTHHLDEPGKPYKFDKNEFILRRDIGEIAERIAEFGCKNVIFTGGEPMLQQDELVALMDRLRSESPEYRFDVETNGTLIPDAEFQDRIDHFNVSPKLDNSGNKEKLRIKPEAMGHFAGLPNADFKFVAASPQDCEEILKLVAQFAIPKHRVFLMPEGILPNQINAKAEWILDVCLKYGFNFSTRQHVQIWGAEPGK